MYSSRKIERLFRNHVHFLLILDGHEAPDHTTIARFRTRKATGKAMRHLFERYVNWVEKREETDHEAVYVDGTKLESKATRYTVVWRKTVERE